MLLENVILDKNSQQISTLIYMLMLEIKMFF
jgi:hypothetical protein